MHINDNASVVRKYRHITTGRVMEAIEGFNTNTGAPILWLKVTDCRTQRFTGANIAKVYAEIDAAVASGEAIPCH